MPWDIAINETLRRREVHARFGGSRQNGISPSAQTPNILLFSNSSGSKYGYNFDGWHDDGTFHYTGEGQVDDQTLTRGNLAIAQHLETGKALRLFESGEKGKPVAYRGEFQIDENDGYFWEEAPDRYGKSRLVIVFRLHALGVDSPATPAPQVGPNKTVVTDIALESHVKETFQTNPSGKPTLAEKREAALVQRYGAALESQGHRVGRNQIAPKGSVGPIYTDLYDHTTRELVEAKGTSSRVAIRMSIGQLFDYRRYVKPDSLAVLLPTRPMSDLMELIHDSGISCAYETDLGKFERVDPPAAS